MNDVLETDMFLIFVMGMIHRLDELYICFDFTIHLFKQGNFTYNFKFFSMVCLYRFSSIYYSCREKLKEIIHLNLVSQLIIWFLKNLLHYQCDRNIIFFNCYIKYYDFSRYVNSTENLVFRF